MSFSLKLNGRSFTFFKDFSFTFKYDSVASSFGFTALFDPSDQFHRELFKPGSFTLAEVFFRDKLVMTGRILNNKFKSSSKKEPVSLVGYSLPGKLEDVSLAKSSYPLQFDGMSITEIAERCCNPYEIVVVVDPVAAEEANSVLTETEIKESQSIKSYLTEITNQKNLLLTHTATGELLITKAGTDKVPIDDFGLGMSATSIALNFNGQKMHSDIVVVKQASVDTDNTGEASIKNPYVSEFRSTTKNQSSGDDNDSAKFARSLLSAELKNIVVTVETDRIEWKNGELMQPNEIVTVKSDENYIFKPTKFFVESVTMKGSNVSNTATLKLVLPEVYNQDEVINIFL